MNGSLDRNVAGRYIRVGFRFDETLVRSSGSVFGLGPSNLSALPRRRVVWLLKSSS